MATATTTDYAILAQRLIDGDSSVTSAQLEKARVNDQIADLKAQAARNEESARAVVQAEADRHDREQAFARNVDGAAAMLGTARRGYATLVEAVRSLDASTREYASFRRQLVGEARVLGQDVPLPEVSTALPYFLDHAASDARNGLHAASGRHVLRDAEQLATIAAKVDAATPASDKPGGTLFERRVAKRAANDAARADAGAKREAERHNAERTRLAREALDARDAARAARSAS
jgi:hypothetical protein